MKLPRLHFLHPTMHAFFAGVYADEAETAENGRARGIAKRAARKQIEKGCAAAIALALNLGEANRVYVNENPAE